MVFDKFSAALLKREIVHHLDIKRWAIKCASDIGLLNFKASDAWIAIFKKSRNIVSRKITKFVSKSTLQNADEICATAISFVEKVKIKIPFFHYDNVLNTDQSGFNYLLKSNRMLAIKGEKTTVAKTESKNKMTHSYTIQPIITLSGKLMSPLYICLQEIGGRFGPIVERNVQALHQKCENVYVTCSRSGKLNKILVRDWIENVLYKDANYKYLLLLDSWTGQTGEELFEHVDPDIECERMHIPDNTTDKIQPLDVYGFRQWKKFVRIITNRVILDEIDIDLTTRENIIIMHSLIHNQLSSTVFTNMWKYSWYKSGYINDRPPPFLNVSEALFEQYSEKCSQDICEEGQFIKCGWCRKYLCFSHFFMSYHYHNSEDLDMYY